MRRTAILVSAAVLLSLTGVYICSLLVARHLGASKLPAWVDAICEGGSQGGGCDAVLHSRWGSLPPDRVNGPNWRVQIPVAGLGLTYFTFLLTWFAGVGRCGFAGRRWHRLPMVIGAGGLAASIFYTINMGWVIGAWCPLCLSTHAVNLVLFIVIILMRPHRPVVSPESEPASPAACGAGGYPTTRHAVVTVALAIAVVGVMNQSSTINQWQRQTKQIQDMLIEIRDHPHALVSMFRGEPVQSITASGDDPIRGGDSAAAELVVWSDFECRKCRSFAEALHERHVPAFGDRVNVVFKHYPLSSECNPHVDRVIHPRACERARLAEAVYQLAGNDAFWRVHDAMFAGQDDRESLTVDSVAALVELDSAELTARMESSGVAERIAADVEQGHALSVSGTPAAFLNGRRVPRLAMISDVFWRSIAADSD